MKNIPKTRQEFERNFHILEELMRGGRIKFAPGLVGAIDGLLRVRKLPNGRINFLTVDESARLMANMSAGMREMDLPIRQKEQEQNRDTNDAEGSRLAGEESGDIHDK